MAKDFAPRVAKRERSVIDMSDRLSRDLFKISDEKLLQGARLDEIKLSEITVKEQVRTKFNDASLRELAENIKVNGLIQPLVVHYKAGKHILVCGERRFRAMNLIAMEKAPCFILENKSEQELMAIQFSENSAREALHYIDKADGILNYQEATDASERKIQSALGISKSEVHRSLLIAKMPKTIKEAAKNFNIEKYVLVEYTEIEDEVLRQQVEDEIIQGKITKRAELKKVMKGTTKKERTKLPSAADFLKAIDAKTQGLDEKTRELLKSLVSEEEDNL